MSSLEGFAEIIMEYPYISWFIISFIVMSVIAKLLFYSLILATSIIQIRNPQLDETCQKVRKDILKALALQTKLVIIFKARKKDEE